MARRLTLVGPPGCQGTAVEFKASRCKLKAKKFMAERGIQVTGSFSFGNMSAIFIRDPDRNVIELDAYGEPGSEESKGYAGHPG